MFLNKYGRLSETSARVVLRGVCKALNYLENKNISHRDVKLENILISNQFEVKLADFGLCCPCNHHCHDFVGTSTYMAPEVVERRA
mmetsp:Transcript_73340/g.158752  ORF Transcript_73340/g.158752 Transcript_73340/m.158752 type:complete len:86 (-) Transcript_73340:354-611(-)